MMMMMNSKPGHFMVFNEFLGRNLIFVSIE